VASPPPLYFYVRLWVNLPPSMFSEMALIPLDTVLTLPGRRPV
jgi:hypothetical protein